MEEKDYEKINETAGKKEWKPGNGSSPGRGQQVQRAALLKTQQRVMQKRPMQKPGMRTS